VVNWADIKVSLFLGSDRAHPGRAELKCTTMNGYMLAVHFSLVFSIVNCTALFYSLDVGFMFELCKL
jgi:hypothetical protein